MMEFTQTSIDRPAIMNQGYQVYKGAQGADVEVKQEPTESNGIKQNQTNGDVDKDDIREVLTQILNSHKELSVITVIEDLVRRNVLLTQSDAKEFKPTSRESSSKMKAAGTKDLEGSVLQLKDPTSTCTTDDVVFSNLNEALVETNVSEESDPEFDAGLVCAVGSKVNLMTPEGQTLPIALTYYWCNFCNVKSERRDVVLKHMLDHRFHCKYCKFQSFSRAAVIHHSVQQHEEFNDVAPTLKYCTYLADVQQRAEHTQNKRKREDEEDENFVDENSNDEESEEDTICISNENEIEDQPSPKKARYDEELSMEVEEVGVSGEVSSSLTNKIIIPTAAKNQTLPFPVKMSIAKETEAATTLLSTNIPNTTVITLPVSLSSVSVQPGAMQSESPSSVSSSSSSSNVYSSHISSSQSADDNLPIISSVHTGTAAVEKNTNSISNENENEDQPSPKKARYDEELSMEVEEVGVSGEVSTSLTNKIVIPTAAKNQTLPFRVKMSIGKESEAVTTLLSTNIPNTTVITLPVSQSSVSVQPGPMQSESSSSVSSSSSSSNVYSSPISSSQSADDNLPIISSVHSGTAAVEKARTQGKHEQKPLKSSKPRFVKETELCWNCGHCGFVTLSQAFLKIHLHGDHQGKPHKYVAMLVSSETMLDRIRMSDRKMLPLHPNPEGSTNKSEDQTSLEKTQDKEASPISFARIPPQENIADPGENVDEKKIPVSYKCAHCNLGGPDPDKLIKHLKARHMGCVMYVLDMKAVKLRQKRYLFFCLTTGCGFKTKEVNEYLEHIETCTPKSPTGKSRVDVASLTLKSLNLTKQFITSTSCQSHTKGSKLNKAAEYGCLYCYFQTNNNTRIKKHVLFNHQNRPTAISNVSPLITEEKQVINFCRICLWEARGETELGDHLSKEHNDTSNQGLNSLSKQANTNIEHQSAVSLTSNVDNSTGVIQEKSESPVVSENDYSNSSTESASSTEIPSNKAGNNSQHDYDNSEIPYIGVIGKTEYEKALAMYVTSEYLGKKRASGRPQRNAAVKSKIHDKLTKRPPLYKCFHCEEFLAFGSKLMKDHILHDHESRHFQAYDRLKLEKSKEQAIVYFCPFEINSDNCEFTSHNVANVLIHAKKKHEMQRTDASLQFLSGISSSLSINSTRGQRQATATTGESYECLYCLHTSLIFHARLDIKKHLIKRHPKEDFVIRDCIARKLAQQSRVYMCHMLTCDFTCENQKDYKLHCLAHIKSKIYQCSQCDWFTVDSSAVRAHARKEHGSEKLTTVVMDLDFDSTGTLVKLVEGTVIKLEKEW